MENFHAFTPGTIIANRYQVVDTLGEGETGLVLKVQDKSIDDDIIALKLLYPHLAEDKILFARFRNEVLLARKLAHPNIVTIYDIGQEEHGYHFISMEYIPGANLQKRIFGPGQRKIPLNEILRILYETAQAMAHAHSQGVVHRDLRPEKVLFTDRGDVKISDFGLARLLSTENGLTASSKPVGTPAYMSPEQLRGEKVDPRSDIYSLGVIAYEMATGEKLFPSDNPVELAQLQLNLELPEFTGRHNEIPPWYETFVKNCTSKNKNERLLNMDEVCRVIVEHLPKDMNPKSLSMSSVVIVPHYTKRAAYRMKALLQGAICVFMALSLLTLCTWFIEKPGNIFAMQSAVTQTTLNALQQDLFQAVNSADKTRVLALISKGIDINKGDAEGKTALIHSSIKGHIELISLLKEQGAFTDLTDAEGCTALIRAVQNEHPAAAKLLIEYKTSLNIKDKHGRTAMHYAVLTHQKDILEALLVAGADSNINDASGSSPKTLANLEERKLINLTLRRREVALADETNRVSTNETNSTTSTINKISSTPIPGSAPKNISESFSGSAKLLIKRPVGEWEAKTERLKSLQVKLRNIGTAPASGIVVKVFRPGQRKELAILNGPEEVPVGKEVKFEYTFPSPISSKGDLEAKASCKNCTDSY